jgi:hypothetical protein
MKEGIKWGGTCEKHCVYFRNINSKFYCVWVPKQYPIALMCRNEEGELNEVGNFE